MLQIWSLPPFASHRSSITPFKSVMLDRPDHTGTWTCLEPLCYKLYLHVVKVKAFKSLERRRRPCLSSPHCLLKHATFRNISFVLVSIYYLYILYKDNDCNMVLTTLDSWNLHSQRSCFSLRFVIFHYSPPPPSMFDYYVTPAHLIHLRRTNVSFLPIRHNVIIRVSIHSKWKGKKG